MTAVVSNAGRSGGEIPLGLEACLLGAKGTGPLWAAGVNNHLRGDVHESLFREDRAATLFKKLKGRTDVNGNLSLLRKVMQAGACESW